MMYFTKKPRRALRGHNAICIGLPNEPCDKSINVKTDYPDKLDNRGVMYYRCQTCHEKKTLRETRQYVAEGRQLSE